MLPEFAPHEAVTMPFHGIPMEGPLGNFPEPSVGLALAPAPTLDTDFQAFSLASNDFVYSPEEISDQTPLLDSEPALSSLPDPLLGGATVAGAWQASLEELSHVVRSPQSARVVSLAFGESKVSQAESILNQILSGQQRPQLTVLPMAELAARGAYAADSETIFLAQELLSQPEQLKRVLLEELGHFADDQINPVDTPGDEGALFAALVMGDRLTATDIRALQTENDTATLDWDGQRLQVERADLEPGVFTVDPSGQITVEFIADSSGYESQVAVFSLEGMEGLAAGSVDFIREAARRALTNSPEGYVVIDDATEKAALSGELGEIDLNSGITLGSKTFNFAPGANLAVMLVPNDSVQAVFDNPAAEGSLRPLFSLAAANPDERTHIGQIRPGLFALEDLRFDVFSDGDFNDLIFSLQGAAGQVESVTNLFDFNRMWPDTSLGRTLFDQPSNVVSSDSPENSDSQLPGNSNPLSSGNADPFQVAILDSVPKFTTANSEAQIAASGAASINLGTQTIYIGTNQVSSNNQNPIIASFDNTNPANNWVRTDYETTGTDGRGLGLAWDGTALYGVFSVDGTQGNPAQDFRRASGDAQQAWLRSYGQGGGAKVSVLGQIDPATGTLLNAAYLSAVLNSGNSNTLTVNDLSINDNGNLLVSAESFFSPRRPDGTALTQITPGGSPFTYTVELTPDLKRVVSTAAPGWV